MVDRNDSFETTLNGLSEEHLINELPRKRGLLAHRKDGRNMVKISYAVRSGSQRS